MQAIIQRAVSLAEQVSDFLIKEIKNGRMGAGDILPTEADLSSQLGVSRSVVREAISRLKHDGLIESQKGGRSKISQDTSGSVFRFDVLTHKKTDLEKLYELRAIIEPEAAAIAATRSTPEQIKTLKNRLHDIKAALAKGEEGTDESLSFHRAILEASGNPHLAQIVSWVDKKLWSFTQSKSFYKNGDLLCGVHAEHEGIVKAIEEGDPKKARKISRKHVVEAAKRHDLVIDIP